MPKNILEIVAIPLSNRNIDDDEMTMKTKSYKKVYEKYILKVKILKDLTLRLIPIVLAEECEKSIEYCWHIIWGTKDF